MSHGMRNICDNIYCVMYIPSALNRSFPLFLCVSRTPYILAKSLAPVSDLDPLDTILYDGTEYGIVTVDMMYKGHMLSVSGDGLDEFFSTLEAQIHRKVHVYYSSAFH